MSRRAVELALQGKQQERAATYEAGVALYEGFFGNVPTARQRMAAALKLSRGREVEYGAAFALALAGDYSKAQALANGLEKAFPEDTTVRINYLPSLRALLALHENDPAKALDLLHTTDPYEFAVPGINNFGFLGGLYPVYVRGEAYLALGRSEAAAKNFRKSSTIGGSCLAIPSVL